MFNPKGVDHKVILLGESDVGKTSIINSTLFRKFSENQISTVGAEYCVKNIFSDEKFSIGIWDTAGQEKFRSLIPLYFRSSQGVILVFDLTNEDSFLKIPQWISLYHNNSNYNADFILIGNKKDLQKERKVRDDMIMRFAEYNKYDYFETSALTGENIEDAFYDIAIKMHTRLKETNTAEKTVLRNNPKKKFRC